MRCEQRLQGGKQAESPPGASHGVHSPVLPTHALKAASFCCPLPSLSIRKQGGGVRSL